MGRKKSDKRRPEVSTGSEPATDLLEPLLKVAVAGLVVVRLLVPPEASVQGETLWITQLWLGVAVLWAWNAWRTETFSIRFTWLDAAVWTLVAGHVVSAVAVLVTSGDKRAALNMLWEWVGLGVAFSLIRQLIATRDEGRRLAFVLLAATTVFAGLGIWQHFVWYPSAAREYYAAREELDQLTRGGALSAEQVQRANELQRQFTAWGAPLEGPGREMWENRLSASTEPFGTFALANTFAGLLAVGVFLGIAFLVSTVLRRSEPHGRWGMAAAGLAVVLIAYCLVLTKSRTAFVGAAAGAGVWGLLWFRRGREWSPRWRMTAAAAGVLVVLVAAVATFSGGLDREVISEAPRSLKFRLQYWSGSLEILKESPIFGTGPGNFRQHYLRHKLPESSEEIAEPHNFVFDVWTSGGLLGLFGMLAVMVTGAMTFLRATAASGETGTNPLPRSHSVPLSSDPLVVGATLAFVLWLGLEYVLGSDLGVPLSLALGWVAAAAILAPVARLGTVGPAALGAGAAALLVHLLGAGGIEMPAIAQVLLLLPALAAAVSPWSERTGAPGSELEFEDGWRGQEPKADGPGARFENRPDRGLRKASNPATHASHTVPNSSVGRITATLARLASNRRTVLGAGGLAVVLFATCLLTATVPVLHRRSLVQSGDAALMYDGNAREAQSLYASAAEADPFSSEPAERLANLAFERWKSEPTGDREGDFEQMVELSRMAIALDPLSPNGYRQLGERLMARFLRTGKPEHAAAAAAAFADAVARYPHNAALRVQFAQALRGAGQWEKAIAELREAIRLDAINRAEGHRDKVLPIETNGFRLLGEWQLERHERTGATADAAAAAEAFEEATRLFPENPSLTASWAEALLAAGRAEDAAKTAAEALRLNVAEDWASAPGLTEKQRDRMREIEGRH